MIDYILDANVIISALISGKADTKALFQYYNFSSPEFLFNELDTHKNVILSKTRFDTQDLNAFTISIFKNLNVLPHFVLSTESLEKSHNFTKNVDTKDLYYVALAIELNQILLTRDKPLERELRKQGFRKVMMFDMFIEQL